MDRLTKYRQMLKKIILDFAESLDDSETVEKVLFLDEEYDNYMLQCLGWKSYSRVDRRYILVRLRNGKIYIDDDWTQDGIAAMLVEAGVPPEDIVLAFNPPEVRALTGFAVA